MRDFKTRCHRQKELRMQFALGANHDIERKIGYLVWKQTNLIESSITETPLMHLKKNYFNYFIVFEVKKEKCRSFANEHPLLVAHRRFSERWKMGFC